MGSSLESFWGLFGVVLECFFLFFFFVAFLLLFIVSPLLFQTLSSENLEVEIEIKLEIDR